MTLPPNPYTFGTELWTVYERLIQGECCGADFLNMKPEIKEYRSRLSKINHFLKEHGFKIDRKNVSGSKFKHYSIKEIDLFDKEAA